MSRASEVLNDLELAAKKLGMSIEEAVSVLLGKHPTHVVVQAHKETAETDAKIAASNAAATEGNAAPGSSTASAQTASSAGSASADTPQPGEAA